jgi:hypothetical protein
MINAPRLVPLRRKSRTVNLDLHSTQIPDSSTGD